MLGKFRPGRPSLAKVESVDALLRPLLLAAQAGEPLEPPLLEIALSFGFESFVYGISTGSRPDRDSRTYVWTSLPARGWQAYERERLY